MLQGPYKKNNIMKEYFLIILLFIAKISVSQTCVVDPKVDSVITYYFTILDKVMYDSVFLKSDSSYSISEINDFFISISNIDITAKKLWSINAFINEETLINWKKWYVTNKYVLKWNEIEPFVVKHNNFIGGPYNEEEINKWIEDYMDKQKDSLTEF